MCSKIKVWCFLIGGLTPFTDARAELNIVTTTPGLAALAQEVVQNHGHIQSLSGPTQDPHFIDGRPSLVLKLHRADLLISIGLGLEAGWLPPLVLNARNSKIQRTGIGHFDASQVCGPLLGILTTKIDRRMGDLHPSGDPHYLLDPRYGVRVANALAKRLGKIAPKHRDQFEKNARGFKKRMNARILQWEARMKPFVGASVVSHHKRDRYLTNWLKLKSVGTLEPVPGISPSAKHLAQLILHMHETSAQIILIEPWYDPEPARVVAQKTAAKIVHLPGDVGDQETQTYEDFIERIVRKLETTRQ